MDSNKLDKDNYVDDFKVKSYDQGNQDIQCCCIPSMTFYKCSVVLSIIYLFLSLIYHHFIGILFSLSLILLSMKNIQIYRNRVVNRIQFRHAFKLQVLQTFLFSFVTFLLFIRIINIPQKFSETVFPYECTSLGACSRIAKTNPHNTGDLLPIQKTVSENSIQQLVEQYIHNQGYFGAYIQQQNDCYIKGVFISKFFGFLDDFGINYCCEGKKSIIQVQSESRKAGSDFGVNLKRVQDFYDFFEHYFDKQGFHNEEECISVKK